MNLNIPLIDRVPDDDQSFGIAQITQADALAKRDPGRLTDRQLRILATYDYDGAQVAARQRAEARAKAAAPAPAAPKKPAAAKTRQYLIAGEELSAFAKRAPHAPTPISLFVELLSLIKEMRDEERGKREVVEAQVRRVDSLLVLYEARIKSLETNTSSIESTFAGEYEQGRSYQPGEVVKRKGTPWLCTKATAAAPGMAPTDWELFFK
jgi:hypothetical protein